MNTSNTILTIGFIGITAAFLLYNLQLKPAAARLRPDDNAGCLGQGVAMFLLTILAIPAFLALALTAIAALLLFLRLL